MEQRFYYPNNVGVSRTFGDATIHNLITQANSGAISLAQGSLAGTHPMTISSLSDRAYYVLRGNATFKVADQEFSVGSGDAVLVPKNTPHGYSGNVQYIVVNTPPFDPSAETSLED